METYESSIGVAMTHCFWCGEPMGIVLNRRLMPKTKADEFSQKKFFESYEPCKKCAEYLKKGIQVISVSRTPMLEGLPEIAPNLYPKNHFVVITEDAAKKLCNSMGNSEEFWEKVLKTGAFLMPEDDFDICFHLKEVEEQEEE